MSRIYLVDDHAIVRDGLRSMLEGGSHQVVGEAAEPTLALAELQRLDPDLLLLDLHLDGRSGFELLSEVQRRGLRVRTLVLTMSVQPRDVAEAMRMGAVGYLLKDSPRAELLRAVDSVSRGQRHLGPEVAELAVQAFTEASQGDLLGDLSPRERQIITLVVKGRTSQVIGAQLHLSPKTVDTYRSRLMAKLGVADVTALVRFAIRSGLIDADGN
jgi:two-component system invasion response regulator UvrY